MDIAALRLDPRQLADVAQTLEARIREGLAADGREVKALPAHLGPPRTALAGEALVVDAGGTNVRAAWVRLGERDEVLAGPATATLPVRGDDAPGLDADGFWLLQAELAAKLRAPAGLPLGYCFSYPSTVHGDRDATLLAWTKGVDIPGVVGERVGASLAGALARLGLEPARTVVLNDTVAALLGGPGQDPERTIGLIAGTGTNMAAYFRPEVAPKLGAFGPGPMAVNLESGNFHPPHLTPIDDEFDATHDPGRQRFEKAVSGYALPYLLAQLLPDGPGFDPAQGSEPVVRLRTSGSGPKQAAAAALLDRSADLIAAGLVGVARVLGGKEPVTVLAEGGLFWKAPGYADRVEATMAALAPGGPRFTLARRPEVNLFGSAAAALGAQDSRI